MNSNPPSVLRGTQGEGHGGRGGNFQFYRAHDQSIIGDLTLKLVTRLNVQEADPRNNDVETVFHRARRERCLTTAARGQSVVPYNCR